MGVSMAQPSALELWIEQYGGIIYFFGQLIFWLALAVAAIYAVMLLKRLVDFKTGVSSPSGDAPASSTVDETSDADTASSSADDSEPIDIDKFVE